MDCIRFLPVLCFLLAAQAFAADTAVEPIEHPGERVALRAASLIGTPYRFGSASPTDGFDCSGLVHFSYRDATGVSLPRTTGELRLASQRIERAELRPGDLIFFRLRGPHGHVGIYAGEGRFVHAPSRGKKVRVEQLDAPFWQRKVADTRRPVL